MKDSVPIKSFDNIARTMQVAMFCRHDDKEEHVTERQATFTKGMRCDSTHLEFQLESREAPIARLFWSRLFHRKDLGSKGSGVGRLSRWCLLYCKCSMDVGRG